MWYENKGSTIGNFNILKFIFFKGLLWKFVTDVMLN